MNQEKQMYAIIRTGSKQYKVSQGDVINVEKLLDKSLGESVQFEDVLFVFDGKDYSVGAPNVKNCVVEGEILKDTYGKKIQSMKYMPRKRNKRKFGHKQQYHEVKINKIAKK